jgi:malate permease and related proteins
VIPDILIPVGRLFLLTAIGFAVFKIEWLERHLLKPFVFLMLNVIFPLYFVHLIPSGWADGLEVGWHWMLIFFGAFLVFMGVQFALAKALINRVKLLETDSPRELMILFAMHNAGYIPLPILAALAPPAVNVYMAFYVMAFILSFFTIAVWIIQGAAGSGRPKLTINPPVVGILLGLVVAVTGIYGNLPAWVTAPFRWSSYVALDAVMVLLGGILAALPEGSFRYRREYGGLILVKMLIYPAAVLGILALIPLEGVQPEIASAIKLAFVLEAVVPPATNIMVITRAYGTEDQVRFAGGAMLFTYAASLVLIPLFLILATVAF